MGLFSSFLGSAKTQPLVLHVDDSNSILEMGKSMLAQLGCASLQAYTGAEAIALAKSKRPNLILLDAVMPDMDGFETCQRLKNDAATREIPILMVTSSDAVKDVERAMGMGAAAYLIKPLQLERLKAKIGSLIQLQETGGGATQQFLKLFLEEGGENIKAFKQSLEVLSREPAQAQALEKTYRAVHSIRGLAAQMELQGIVDLTRPMEALLLGLKNSKAALTMEGAVCLTECAGVLEGALALLKTGSPPAAAPSALIERVSALADRI